MRTYYDPNRQGWGFAAGVCLLAAGMLFTAYTIHSKTYRHPRDTMNTQVYSDRDAAKSHEGAAAGEHATAGEHGAAGEHADSAAKAGAGAERH